MENEVSEYVLPEIQPDRAWAEHLGMDRLIAENARLKAEVAELEAEAPEAGYCNECGYGLDRS